MTASAKRRHLGCLLAVGDADADADRQVRHLPGTRDQRPGELRGGRAGAGHSHDRGGVDESAARIDGVAQPLVGRGRGDQEDLVEVVGVGRGDPLLGRVGGQVGRDQARSPASARSGAKRSTPYLSTGFQYVITTVGAPVAATASTVRITSEVRMPPSRARWRRPGSWSVHHRVAVGQPDLDDVAARVDHHLESLDRRRGRRKAGGQVADQRAASLRAGLLKAVVVLTGALGDLLVAGLFRSAVGVGLPSRTSRWRCPCPCRHGRTGSPAASGPDVPSRGRGHPRRRGRTRSPG